jgi:hypothetical protein
MHSTDKDSLAVDCKNLHKRGLQQGVVKQGPPWLLITAACFCNRSPTQRCRRVALSHMAVEEGEVNRQIILLSYKEEDNSAQSCAGNRQHRHGSQGRVPRD